MNNRTGLMLAIGIVAILSVCDKAYSYELSLPSIPIDFMHVVSTYGEYTITLKKNYSGDWDGIRISWRQIVPILPEGFGNQPLATMSRGTTLNWPESDKQRISKVVVGLYPQQETIYYEYFGYPHPYPTNLSTPLSVLMPTYGRPEFFVPDFFSAEGEYQFNWYVSEYSNYLEVVPLTKNAFRPMIIAIGNSALGQTMGAQFARPNVDIGNGTIVLHGLLANHQTPVTNIKISTFRNHELNSTINSNYSIPSSPPRRNILKPIDWNEIIHKSSLAVPLVSATLMGPVF